MLYRDLEKIAQRDPEQEVRGLAIPLLEACLQAYCAHVADDHPIVGSIRDGLLTPEVVTDGSVRAVDAAVVAHQLAHALGPENPVATAPVFTVDPSPGLFSSRGPSF